MPLVSNAGSTATGGGFQCTIGPVNDRGLIMSGISYNTLVTQIRNYTEVDANVFTTDVLESFILNAQQRIMMDLPMDSDRFVEQGTMAADVNNIRVPAGSLFVRGVEVFNATNSTEARYVVRKT